MYNKEKKTVSTTMQKTISKFFPDIYFYDKNHRYKNILHPNRKYRSATGIKKDFIEPFRDRYYAAWGVVKEMTYNRVCDFGGKCAPDHIIATGKEFHYTKVWEKYPDKCQAILDKWEAKAEFGRNKGNAVHDFLENATGRKVFPGNRKYKPWLDQAWDFHINNKYEDVVFRECEVVMADEEYLVAGMADRIDYLGGWDVRLGDIKTDLNINDTDSYNMMKPPFDHLAQNPIGEYSIQLNIYCDLIERNTPYSVKEIELINITEKNWSIWEIDRFKVLELL